MLFSTSSIAMSEINAAGWSYSINGTTLTISGSGKMTDYANYMGAPWYGKTIEKLVIGEGITYVGNYAFANLKDLNSVNFPSTLKTIGANAFYNCRKLTNVKFNDSLEKIGENAFYYCYGLETIELGNSLKTIGDYAFGQCTVINNINIPTSVEKIGANAFAYCYGLTDMFVPANVTYIGANAFAGDADLVITCYAGSYVVKYAKDNNIKTNIIGGKYITVTVQDGNGASIGEDAIVELYDKSGNIIKTEKTEADGTCKIYEQDYKDAKSIVAYEDKNISGGSNRSAARASYNNVLYVLRLHSMEIDNHGTWQRTKFNGKDITLKLNSPRYLINMSLCYYYDNTSGDYYDDIVEMIDIYARELNQATDGYLQLNSIAIFNTSNATDFYNSSLRASMADIRIEDLTDIHSNATVWTYNGKSYTGGFFSDTLITRNGSYSRIQMSKETRNLFEIGTSTVTEWAQSLTHETGHYVLCMADEYLNGNGVPWGNGLNEHRRPNGTKSNFGLMEYQWTDIEMSVETDYTYLNSNNYKGNAEWETNQYFANGMDCWSWFKYRFTNTYADGETVEIKVPNGSAVREHSNDMVDVTIIDARNQTRTRSAVAATSSYSLANAAEAATEQFVSALPQNDKVAFSIFSVDGSKPTVYVNDYTASDYQKVTVSGSGKNYSTDDIELNQYGRATIKVETSDGTKNFDIALVEGEEIEFVDKTNTIGYSGNATADGKAYFVVSKDGNVANGNLNSVSEVVSITSSDLTSGTLYAIISKTDDIDFSSVSWYKLIGEKWIRISSTMADDEHSSIRVSTPVKADGVYAVMANAANSSIESADGQYFTAQANEERDGSVTVSINYAENDILGYYVYFDNKNIETDKLESARCVFYDGADNNVNIRMEEKGSLCYVYVVAKFENGTRKALGDVVCAVTSEYCVAGSKIPYWWVCQYRLNEYEDQVVDNLDYDNDGYTNYQEYINGTDPTVADVPSVHTHNYVTTMIEKPTCTQNGVNFVACEYCEVTYTESIEKLGHSNIDGNGNCVVCGEHLKDLCPHCGKEHTGLFGAIIAFFHNILYKITHLFK